MTIRSYGIAIAMTLVMLGSPAYGQSPSCYDDMIVPGRCLPWGFTNLAPQLAPGGFLPTDFSRDGTTVTGHDEAGTVFRWNLETMGAQTLNLGGDQFVHGTFPVMSADGSVIAGTTILSGASSIFRWDAVAPDIMILPNGSCERNRHRLSRRNGRHRRSLRLRIDLRRRKHDHWNWSAIQRRR